MRRIIPLALLALTLLGGTALADRDHRGSRHHDRRGGVVVRNHQRPQARPVRHVNVQRRPVYVNNGYYHFNNGARYRYTRPVIRQRYYDYRVRPQIIVENYQPMAGYVWVAGNWQWNGAEWIWISGHYAIDPRYAY